MKTIAIFCDGTWNSPTIAEPTHVHELFEATKSVEGQVSIYIQGIGARVGVKGWINRQVDRFGGGAFGWGLGANVKEAYRQLAETYESGDQIMIFGFSRGAYTARALAGMLRTSGLPNGPGVSNRAVNRAFRLYSKKADGNHPDAPHIQKERHAISPSYATSTRDQNDRNDGSALLQIAYLGVWDTVGAKGLPVNLLRPEGMLRGIAHWWNKRYQFYDNALSSMVRAARHAVAVDENRKTFIPSLWFNLDGAEGLNKGADGENRPYQQLWFIGKHSILGGSSERNEPLSALSLEWVLAGAKDAGLALNPSVTCPDVAPNALEVGFEIDRNGGLTGAIGLAARDELRALEQLHESVLTRYRAIPTYRPQSMQHITVPGG